jgi:hypothetical protein
MKFVAGILKKISRRADREKEDMRILLLVNYTQRRKEKFSLAALRLCVDSLLHIGFSPFLC